MSPKRSGLTREFIQKAAERTAAVTAQLLAFSRRQVLKPEVLDLNALLTKWEPCSAGSWARTSV